ncbi:HEAT repeat domain-containing protein [Pseudotenacibaculum sp. MALMAid0570]|uniref:HEAT repeat domain-containing protein n=1 Tax=Pseudotenacibaculum sp. MALMAid0570 TaxID=3143938 RepID=UPI0032E04E94
MNLKDYIQDHKAEFEDQKVSSLVDEKFEQKLKKTLHQPKRGKVVYLKYFSIAASLVLIVSTVFWLQDKIYSDQKRTEILADLEDESTGVRLEAVYEFSDVYQKEDKNIIKVLIKTLLTDKNANVKIATIDALLKFPQNQEIRESLIEALSKEKQPLVQIKLINSLSILREQRAKEPLEEIIKNEKTFEIVKSNASMAMANLKQ